MDSVHALDKLADSKLAAKLYDDAVAPAAQECGNALLDVVKVVRLFTAPIQLLAAAQDRLARFCLRIGESVPVERRIDAAPSVAGPVLLALRFMEEDSPVTELFLNLLRRAIDRDRVDEAHPAFPRIIEQLCPDEAIILYSLRECPFMCTDEDVRQHNSFPFHRLSFPRKTAFYLAHLKALDLVHVLNPSFAQTTPFGEAFIKACVPDKIENIAPFHLEPTTASASCGQ